VSWDKAVNHVASGLRRIIDEYGPGGVAFYSGAVNTTEEYYLINKLFKGYIGTNNVECSIRLCMASTAAGLVSTVGADAPPTCYDDIEEADLFFIAGNNMAVSLPIIFYRLCQAREKNGAKVIVVDPRRTETARIADIHLQIRPGTDVALNNALAHILFKEGFVDEERVESYCSGIASLKECAAEYPPSRASGITGCSVEQIVEAARLIGRSKAMLTFWFQGYNHSTQALFKNNSLHNLSLLTENFCRPGAGPLSITGEANAMGCRWTGALSPLLPGMRSVTNPQHRQEVADLWGIDADDIGATPGRSIMEIIEGLHSGDVRALWVMSSNPTASLPHTSWVEEGLSRADLLIVQDIFHPTETTMVADVILPAAQWCERSGTFISSERCIELVDKMVEPPGDAKPDYEILWMIARAMGFEDGFPYTSPEEVFEEVKDLFSGRICGMSGVTYERLCGQVGPQLPCPDPDHPGTPRLFTDLHFPRPDGRAALLAREYIEPAETPDGDYPFILNTGRGLKQFNTRTRSGRVPHLDLAPSDRYVEIHPEDASRLAIEEGDEVEIASRRGALHVVARITDRVLTGNLYMNMHYGKAPGGGGDCLANIVTNPVYDIHSMQPEFKFTAVSIVNATGG